MEGSDRRRRCCSCSSHIFSLLCKRTRKKSFFLEIPILRACFLCEAGKLAKQKKSDILFCRQWMPCCRASQCFNAMGREPSRAAWQTRTLFVPSRDLVDAAGREKQLATAKILNNNLECCAAKKQPEIFLFAPQKRQNG